jgi:hypothetical protein
MGIARKLEDVHRDLTRLAEQGGVVGFLTNTENEQRINGLVEEIREVMMDYQVCIHIQLIPAVSKVRTRPHYSKISTTRVVCSS